MMLSSYSKLKEAVEWRLAQDQLRLLNISIARMKNQISILSKLLKDSFVLKTAEERLWPVLGCIDESHSENRVIFQHVSRLRLTMLTARLRPFDLLCTGKIKVHLSFSSHRQGLALLPVPSLSLSRSQLFDDVRDNFDHGAPRSQRLFDGSLKARRQQAEPAKQLPMTPAIHAQLW